MQTSLKCIYVPNGINEYDRTKQRNYCFPENWCCSIEKYTEHLYQITIYNASNEMNSSIDKNIKHVNDLL